MLPGVVRGRRGPGRRSPGADKEFPGLSRETFRMQPAHSGWFGGFPPVLYIKLLKSEVRDFVCIAMHAKLALANNSEWLDLYESEFEAVAGGWSV
jgi:hypothetical protein